MDTNARVLVVEDDETVLRRYSRMLASANFTVRAAKTRYEAIEILARQTFDVVLMEYLMPGSDGLVVLRTIKDLWPDTEVVVITGAPCVAHAKEAIRLGACDCLAKPVPPDEVRMTVARAANQKKWALRRISCRDSAQFSH